MKTLKQLVQEKVERDARKSSNSFVKIMVDAHAADPWVNMCLEMAAALEKSDCLYVDDRQRSDVILKALATFRKFLEE